MKNLRRDIGIIGRHLPYSAMSTISGQADKSDPGAVNVSSLAIFNRLPPRNVRG